MTTVADILVAARTKVAATPTSRNVAEFFLEHKTNQPFEHTPISKRDGFEIVAVEQKLTTAFGLTSTKEGQFIMIVKLGHAPFGTDKARELTMQQDIARLGDLLEAPGWLPAGVEGVWFETAETEKKNPSWWITHVRFRVLYTGAIEVV